MMCGLASSDRDTTYFSALTLVVRFVLLLSLASRKYVKSTEVSANCP